MPMGAAGSTRLSLRARWILGAAGIGLATSMIQSSPAQVSAQMAEPAPSGGPATLRRLNETQYKRPIQDIFGAGIKVPGRFEPPFRDRGLMAIGDGKVAVSASGL